MDKKFYKIVYGYDEGDYLPITSDELHKAQVIAIEGGKANFETGFYNNRGNDIMRIVPDWHRVRGWNRGYKMTELDYEDIEPLQKSYLKTLENGKFLANYIIKEGKYELLELPASEAYKKIMSLGNPTVNKQLNEGVNQLSNKFQIN